MSFDYNKPFKFRNQPDYVILSYCIVDFDPNEPIYILFANKKSKEPFAGSSALDGINEDNRDWDLVNIEDLSEEIDVVKTMLEMLVPKFNDGEREYFTKTVNKLIEKLRKQNV